MRVILLLCGVLMGCSMGDWDSGRWSDGSGNDYLWDAKTRVLEYVPVRPEQSSTGFYSGGKPSQRVLTAEDLAQVEDLLKLRSEPMDSGASGRGKGTFYLELQGAGKKFQGVWPGTDAWAIQVQAKLKALASQE